MTQQYKKSNAPIILSPDGIRIQISNSNKMKFRNTVNADTGLAEMMKSIIYCLIDKTNEGYGDEPQKFGWAYPLPKTIAEHCGCTERAVWDNLTALEDGVTKNGVTIPERWRLRVNRHGKARNSGGGRSKANWYFLNAWREFGAVDKSGGDAKQILLSGKPQHISGEYGAFSFLDEADGDSIATADGMSRRQQFVALANLYHEMGGRRVDQTMLNSAWNAFAKNGISFAVAVANLTEGESLSLSDCLNQKLPNESDEPF
ncbi:hypothetical protein IVB18_28030 [Bradyrhizobium sp. 186]|uniref:hypothetical protein n=1 Tax=Bradyrhizobium sp. 186 TaxID=2782654 RepID=UPI002001783D|nr:hypothetical protein [Bradyrhizobium sp. 186]UPK32142.1 hypothetical protein IVB18_28030 [Bradyrhizobium sp. 186]